MLSKQIRAKYLEFFKSKGHAIIPSASLIPENDPTVLFTTAGMHPLVPYLLGQKHPLGNRLADSQKCIRTDDIDEVGDTTHLTFFEMLGNWSLGDYFKKEAIEWSFEFLTKELNLPIQKLAVSVFEGEEGIPRDEESAQIWQNFGIPKERIAYLGRKDNWWGPAGQTGPCGPDTEMFYWTGEGEAPKIFDPNDEKWVEIWNDVFMQYNKTAEGQFEPLSQKNVDTGMGLERITAALQEKDNVFETDLFEPIIKKIKGLSLKPNQKAERIIADHIKAVCFVLSEKLIPSNTERGYVLRRLIRRAIRYGKTLGIEDNFLSEVAQEVIQIYRDIYPELSSNKNFIIEQLNQEEIVFSKTIERGLKEFSKISNQDITAHQAFNLYQTYGFPIEMVAELAREKGLKVDFVGFEKELKEHQELSKTAAKGKFKAGLADNTEKTVKCHTATHLLLAALREVLRGDIEQAGSNINPERIRFDFSFDRKMTDQEIKKVEDWVNDKIKKSLNVEMAEMTVQEAQKQGAVDSFREKYPAIVKVYTIVDPVNNKVISKEICSGPHVGNIGSIGHFKIEKEQSSSAGVRRIRATIS